MKCALKVAFVMNDLQVIANGVKLEDGMTAPATIVDLGFDDHNGVFMK